MKHSLMCILYTTVYGIPINRYQTGFVAFSRATRDGILTYRTYVHNIININGCAYIEPTTKVKLEEVFFFLNVVSVVDIYNSEDVLR